MYFHDTDRLELTKEAVAELGADILAKLVLELADKDPGLVRRLRPLVAAKGDPPRVSPPEDEALIIGTSPAMQAVRATLRKIGAAEAPVLITGESGTGKELAAITIHQQSGRAGGPFIPINCAALPKTLIASELFGYEKGAFTGADQRRPGRIQAAHRGTLFLDEIGDLPLDMQVHLLRFLQEGTIDRVGGVHPIKVDARVVAATNVPLRKAVAEGQFREDLFFRLNVLAIEMPPLRQRGADIDYLACYFISKFATESGKIIRGLSSDAQDLVRRYGWPGNIRELIACMRRAVVMTEGPWIHPEDLGLPADADGAGSGPSSLQAARRGVEEAFIRQALEAHRYNIKRTALDLGVSRVTLYRLMEKYGIAAG